MEPESIAMDEGHRELDVRLGLGMFASEPQLEHLLAIARQVDIPAGTVLYEANSLSDTLYQVMSGELSLQAPELASWSVAEGRTAGFVDFMLGRRHARTAVATTPVRLLELDAADYRDYLEDNFEVSHRLMSWASGEIVADTVARAEAEILLTTAAEPRTRTYAKVELEFLERLMVLTRMPVFAGASTQGLASLAQIATETRFAPGEIIAAAETSPRAVALLIEGRVQLTLPSGLVVQRGGRGLAAHLEELAIAPRLNTVVASSPVILLSIEREDLLDRLEEHFDLVLTIFRSIAREQDRLNHIAADGDETVGTGWK